MHPNLYKLSFKTLARVSKISLKKKKKALSKLCSMRFPRLMVKFSLWHWWLETVIPDGEEDIHIQQTKYIFQERFMFMERSTCSVSKSAFLGQLLCLSSDKLHKPAPGFSKNCLFCTHESYCWPHQVVGNSPGHQNWRVLTQQG